MKTKKQKSLGQVACEAYYKVPNRRDCDWNWEPKELQADWRRVARAVVKAAKLKPHLNSAAKTKHT